MMMDDKIIDVEILRQGNSFLLSAGQAARIPAGPPVSKRQNARREKEKRDVDVL